MATRRNRTRKRANQDESIVDVVAGKEEGSFMENNQNLIFGLLTALVVVIAGYLAYKHFIKAPKEEQAMEQIAQAQFQFAQDSFALALTNPGGGFDGFADLASNYSGTDAGNISELYAGISYLQLGQFDVAIDYLKGYSATGALGPILKNGLLGDAYAEQNDLGEALSYYKKAANAGNNAAVTPYYLLKQGLLEMKNNDANAKATFAKIKDNYPLSRFAADAEKYMARSLAVGQ